MTVIEGEIKIIEANENDNMTYQNFWDAAKAVIRGKFISSYAYCRKKEKFQVILYLKELET